MTMNSRNGVVWYEDEYGNETLLRDCKKSECKNCDTRNRCNSSIKTKVKKG